MVHHRPEDHIGETEKNLNRVPEAGGELRITSTQVVQLTGYNQEYIRRPLRTGKVAGKKWGRDWMVEEASLLAYMQARAVRKTKRGFTKTRK